MSPALFAGVNLKGDAWTEVNCHYPAPMHRNPNASPLAVVMFAPFGRKMFEEWVRVQAPANLTSRRQPLNPVPRLVMVAVPVTYTDSASAEPMSVVDAAAMDADAKAFVDRKIA